MKLKIFRQFQALSLNAVLLKQIWTQKVTCDEGAISEISSKKPTMVEFYNQTKGGVDTFDQMCSISSCSRKTRR